MEPLSIEQVLAAEAAVLSELGRTNIINALQEGATKQDAVRRRNSMDADKRDGADEAMVKVQQRKSFYRSLNKLNRSALCLSGGGIRSATFCLGVIQALAAHDVTTAHSPDSAALAKQSQNSLLARFQFLSTVSGGGYIGSWLSSWRKRADFDEVWRGLTGRPDGPDVEPSELSWLRAYSNYLTPRVGVGSADAWAAITIYSRNLLLNWLVIIPVLCLALLLLQLVATLSFGVACASPFRSKVLECYQDNWWLLRPIGLLGLVCLFIGQAFTRHRPPRRTGPSPSNVGQKSFILGDLVWSVFSAVLMTLVFSSHVATEWIAGPKDDPVRLNEWKAGAGTVPLADWSETWKLVALALAGAIVFAVGWILGWIIRGSWRDLGRSSWRDFGCWTLSGIVYGGLVGLGVVSFAALDPYNPKTPGEANLNTLLPMILGIPWVLVSQLAAEAMFVGLTSYGKDADSDREWLGRAGGFTAAAAVGWAVTALLSVGVGHYIIQKDAFHLQSLTASLGAISGVVTALLGKSSLTPATTDDSRQSTMGLLVNLVLAIAGPIFIAALVVGLSVALDALMFHDSLVGALHEEALEDIVSRLVISAIAAAAIGVVASWNVNINRFSLHAVYRNRLVRCYLGATRQKRDPDAFTGFDEGDNLSAAKLWPPKPTEKGVNTFSLFHVVNITLNVVEAKRLAWQERKAEPFTVSALHCGGAYKGFRPTEEYGGPKGLSLGTAMAISGAAVSPNMGYSSSPSIALLLTLFNVRLGWWLGNTGRGGEESYRTEGPSFAVKPLIQEALGLTTDDRRYVYLSDGGHFEDLGLYEMVRRRCRFIVVVDAGEDRNFAFEDLGNAVRKINIDLGITIQFHGLELLINRPKDPNLEERKKIPYHAIGVVKYRKADGEEAGCGDGIILYIKPALHWTEAAGIVSYATAHPAFPHETTTDQWFTESQFESYRSLGFEITEGALARENLRGEKPIAPEQSITWRQISGNLPETTRA
jgi:Patatin-like phospholipase